MLLSVGKLLEKVDNWCCIHGVNVEIVVNDWAMVEMLCGKTSRLHPVLGTLLNKRKKDPRMKYKSGDTLLFQQNSLNAGFYRDFLAENFISIDTEWESCGIHRSFRREKQSAFAFLSDKHFAILSIVCFVHHRRSRYTAACGALSEILWKIRTALSGTFTHGRAV